MEWITFFAGRVSQKNMGLIFNCWSGGKVGFVLVLRPTDMFFCLLISTYVKIRGRIEIFPKQG